MEIIKKHRTIETHFDLVYGFEFSEKGLQDYIIGAMDVGVTWMLDIVSAMRFNGEEALEHIRRGPPE